MGAQMAEEFNSDLGIMKHFIAKVIFVADP